MEPVFTNPLFIWETHGVHMGTGKDHVKHGIDDMEAVVEKAITMGFPGLTFVIHTPRLTRIRYQAEKNTDIKFIRGDRAYFEYPKNMVTLQAKYKGKIRISYGIEMEWMGTGLGLQWNRSKIFQAPGADFVIGSVHFSKEGIPYDGSPEEAKQLMTLRGGPEAYWAGYIEEVIEMISSCWDMIQIVGHLDLPKLHVPVPQALLDLEHSPHFLAHRMRTLLEMISQYNFALDVNLAGLRKGCGVYPGLEILKRAYQLEIPIAIGTDAHAVEDLGKDYKAGIDYLKQTDYKKYVSFSQCIPNKRPLLPEPEELKKFQVLNIAIEMLNRRTSGRNRIGIPKFSFGGSFRSFLADYRASVSLGESQAVRVRKADKSVTISNEPPEIKTENVTCLYAHQTDKPGSISILFNTLASEEINVETAYVQSLHDGTGITYLTLSGEESRIAEAVDFVKGTASDRIIELEILDKMAFLPFMDGPVYLLEVDGVALPIPISSHMILTVHNNKPGVLLTLLSALASRDLNIVDLQLGSRGDKGYAILGVEGNEMSLSNVLTLLGPEFHEVSHLVLNSIVDIV